MYKVEVASKEAKVKVSKKLEYIVLEGDLTAFKMTTELKLEDGAEAVFADFARTSAHEGFARLKAVRQFLNGKASNVQSMEKFSLVHPDYLDLAQQWGYMPGWERLEKSKKARHVSDPFTAFTEQGATLDQIVQDDVGSHMLFDRNGEVLPVALSCDYIGMGLDNRNYNLKDVVEVLKKDARIHFLGDKPIQNIPYYNAENGRTQYIAMLFRPTAEDARILWEKQKSYKTNYPSTERERAIRDLDMLGIEAYRKPEEPDEPDED